MKILDRRMQIWAIIGMVLVFCLNVIQSNAFGYEITDKFSIGGILAGAYQYEDVESGENHDRGALPFQPEISFTPTENDAFFTKFGFAAGNGLNDVTSFTLSPWGADLEDDVKDINGRNRDYLLTVWYKHTFQFNESHTLGLTGGIIDATDYIDVNTFSNDEYTQFMNEALVNAPNFFAPSYDTGAALQWEYGWDIHKVAIKAVAMNVGENDDGNNYNFFATQLGYKLITSLGEGNYRLNIAATNKAFLDTAGDDKENRAYVILSLDQELGAIVGLWLRIGSQDDAAAIDFQNIYSGGINIGGNLWGREEDNIGVGYGYLDGGNLDIDNSQVAELYARFVINKYFAVTPDIQYMRDKYKNGDVIKGFIFGIRLAAGF
ncbi:MAG: carbohydrate porin [Syntrophobacterales bacterium]